MSIEGAYAHLGSLTLFLQNTQSQIFQVQPMGEFRHTLLGATQQTAPEIKGNFKSNFTSRGVRGSKNPPPQDASINLFCKPQLFAFGHLYLSEHLPHQIGLDLHGCVFGLGQSLASMTKKLTVIYCMEQQYKSKKPSILYRKENFRYWRQTFLMQRVEALF